MSQHLFRSSRAPLVFLLSVLSFMLCCVMAQSPSAAVASPGPGPFLASVQCQDQSEPNNYFAQAHALSVNTGYSAAICDPSDADYYRFWVDSGWHLQARLYSLPANLDLVVFDSAYDPVGGSNNGGTSNEVVDYDVATGGYFYLHVLSSKGAYSDSPYQFQMQVWALATETPTPTEQPKETPTATPTATQTCPDPYEPNNSFAEAIALDINTNYSAYICYDGDADYFGFDGVGDNCHIQTYLSSLPVDADLYLLDSGGNILASSTNVGTYNETIDYDVSKGGSFVILAQPKPGEYDPTRLYKFRFDVSCAPPETETPTPTPTPTATGTPLCPDTYEPNDSLSNAWTISPGDLYSYVCSPADADYFRFDVVYDDTVDVLLTELPADYDLYLYDGAGNEQGHSTQGGLTDESVVLQVKVPGAWRIRVDGKGSSDRSSPYRLFLTITHGTTPTPTRSPTVPSCGYDAYEPNNHFNYAAAIELDEDIYGLICPPGDVDFFRFPVTAGQAIVASLSSLPANYDLYLWSPAGLEVENSWRSGTANEGLTHRAQITGDYRVEVRPVYENWHATDTYDLVVILYDATPTPSPTPSPTASPTLLPGLDLTVRYIEVNQVIQTDPPVFDPIWHKPTVVRVYLSTGLPRGSACVPGVTAELGVYRPSGPLAYVVRPYNPGGQICAPTQPDWHNLNDSLNFDLPAEMLEGSWILAPWVNPRHTVSEVNYENNDDLMQPIQFRVVNKHISIKWMLYTYIESPGPPEVLRQVTTRIYGGARQFKASWPVRSDFVTYESAGFGVQFWGTYYTQQSLGRLLENLERWILDEVPRPDHLFGWIPGDVSAFGIYGLARLGESATSPASCAYCKDFVDYATCFAHELGHNYGRDHTNISVQARGFDVLGRQVKPDTMQSMLWNGYTGAPQWIDWDMYRMLYDAFVTGGAGSWDVSRPAVSAPATYVIASGVITATGPSPSAELSALELITRTEAPPAPEGSSYCLEFRAADDSVLQSSCFDTYGTCVEAQGSSRSFVIAVPWPANTTRVLLKSGDTVLAQRSASAHRPAVHVLSPNGGETWDGTQTVTWTGTDADGDTLNYTVLYTHDGGTRWTPLGVSQTTASLKVDTSQLSGGEQCRIQVRVSDGFLNADDLSDGTFTVPRKPPQVLIEAPAEGMWYRPDEYINLIGQANDLEDGTLADDKLEWWWNSETGATMLGTGPMISVGPLAAGDYAISLNAQDSDGNWGWANRTVHVGEHAPQAVYLPLVLKKR